MFAHLHMLVGLRKLAAAALLLQLLQINAAPAYDFDSSGTKPNGHFQLDGTNSVSWPRERQKFRQKFLDASKAFSKDLKKMEVDDTQDSFLWGDLKDFQPDDPSAYWDAICNGTDMSPSNKLPGDVQSRKLNLTAVLADWKMQEERVCQEFVGEEYTDLLEAFKKCIGTCDGLSCEAKKASFMQDRTSPVNITETVGYAASDSQCAKIRLCGVGSFRKKKANHRVFNKPADFAAPGALPRPPQQLSFWRDFCSYRTKGKMIRMMYEGKNCKADAMKELGKAENPVDCFEKVGKDASCSTVFDFRFGPPSACRCLKKNEDCSPEVSDHGHVFGPAGR